MSGFGVPGRDAQYGIDVLLKRCQTLGRCELEHPTNPREIDTVFGISGPWRRSIREIAYQDPVLLPTRSDAYGSFVSPIKYWSTPRADLRPSLIAQTTRNCPRRI